MSIPKNIFLTWFGDEKPAYVDFAVGKYKKMNPDFNVVLIQKNIDQILHPDEPILALCKKMVLDAVLDNADNQYAGNIRFLHENKLNFLQILSDIYRFEVIRQNGGIYVDCDTVPIAPFDESYLEENGFCNVVTAFRMKSAHIKSIKDIKFDMFGIDFMEHLSDYCMYAYTDKYAFGLPKDFAWQIDFSKSGVFKNKAKINWTLNLNNTPLMLECKKKFFSNQLEDKDIKKLTCFRNITPLIHFRENTWRKDDIKHSKLYISELDDLLYPNGKYICED